MDSDHTNLIKWRLDSALDALIDARLALGGDQPEGLDPPTSALLAALDDDAEARRHRARVGEVLDRLRRLEPLLTKHIDEIEVVVQDVATRASEVGFGVGALVGQGKFGCGQDRQD